VGVQVTGANPVGNISAYSVAADGSLSPVAGSAFAAGGGPQAVAVSPDGTRLYAANKDSGNVSAYSVAADGSLSQIAGSPFAAGVHPRAVAVSPDGTHLYVANRQNFVNPGDVSVYSIAADGSLSEVAGSPFTAGLAAYGIALGPDGAHVYVPNALSHNVAGYSVGPGGSLSGISGSPFTAGLAPTGLAVTPDGAHLYASNNFSSNVSGYSVGADGSLSQLTGSPFATGLAAPPSSRLRSPPTRTHRRVLGRRQRAGRRADGIRRRRLRPTPTG